MQEQERRKRAEGTCLQLQAALDDALKQGDQDHYSLKKAQEEVESLQEELEVGNLPPPPSCIPAT